MDELDISNLSRYENDERKPSVNTVIVLANFYNVSIHWLLTGEEDHLWREHVPGLGKRIKFLRESKGLSVQELEKALNIFDLDKFESENWTPGMVVISKLANYFDVSVDWLLTGEGEASKNMPRAFSDNFKHDDKRHLDYSDKIGKKIKHLRTEELKLSLEEFAEAIKVSVQELENYESGEKIIPSYIIYRIISTFNVYPQFLLDPDEPVVFEYKVLEDEDEKERLKNKLKHSLAIGKKILQVRMNQQLMDKKEFAQAIDISEEDLEKYESGTMVIPAYVLHRISQVFDINPSYLLDPEEKTMERIKVQETGDLTEFESGFLHFLKKLPEDEKEEISQILMMKYKKLSKKGRLLTSDNGEDEQAAAKELA